MDRQTLLQDLRRQADPAYKKFNDRIIRCSAPGLGVRMPVLQQLAAAAAKDTPETLLDGYEAADVLYQEEHLLWGLVIGRSALTDTQREQRLDRWVPGILSWGDCDGGVAALKFMGKNRAHWFPYCCKWLGSRREFELRFALVALMQHFLTEEYIVPLMGVFSAHYGDAYYVRMAQAWALCECFVKFRAQTLPLLQARSMDPWVQNKAIQKCRESLRVSPEDKEMLRALKI